MITNAILFIVLYFVRIIILPIRLLSDVVLSPDITTAISDTGEAYDILSTVLPIASIVAITGLFITVETSILLWHGVNWLIRRIPTQN